MPEVPDTVDDAIAPLVSPSTDDVYEATRPFSAREIASAAASEALSGGGGGSPLVTEAGNYSGPTTNIADTNSAALSWEILDAGDDVLDVTAPTLPVARKAGLFIVQLEVVPTAFTTGGSVLCDLTFDYNGDAPLISASGVGGAGEPPRVLIAGSYVLAAGGAMQLFVTNLDGVAARDFAVKNAFVARIGPA